MSAKGDLLQILAVAESEYINSAHGLRQYNCCNCLIALKCSACYHACIIGYNKLGLADCFVNGYQAIVDI